MGAPSSAKRHHSAGRLAVAIHTVFSNKITGRIKSHIEDETKNSFIQLSLLLFLQEIKYFESQYSEEGNEPVADEINRMASLQLADASETPLHSTFGTIPCRTHQEVSSRSDLELSMRDMVIADGPLVLKRTDKDAVKMVRKIYILRFHGISCKYF